MKQFAAILMLQLVMDLGANAPIVVTMPQNLVLGTGTNTITATIQSEHAITNLQWKFVGPDGSTQIVNVPFPYGVPPVNPSAFRIVSAH